jgi:hypothetical protein
MKDRPQFVLIITVLLGMLLACGPLTRVTSPGSNSNSGSVITSTPLTPNPLNVQITLDTASAQTSTGMFYVQAASGANFAMILPEDMAIQDASGSLVPATGAAVTMTPVSGIAGIPFSQGFLAAVDLAPQGMILIAPATLTLTLPGTYDPATLVGFASESNGNNFHLYPIKISAGLSMPGVSTGGTIVTFDILHFSEYGVAMATAAEILDQQAHVPSNQTSQDEDLLAPLQPLSPGDAELDSAFRNALRDQYNNHIKPDIDRAFAMEDCNFVDVAALQFITWHKHAESGGAAFLFEEEIAASTSILLAKLVQCMIPSCALCLGNPPGTSQQTDAFLIHAYYAEQVSIIAGLPSERYRYWTLANQCAANAGRPTPHADTSAGCGTNCVDTNGATLEPPTCPVP